MNNQMLGQKEGFPSKVKNFARNNGFNEKEIEE